MKLTIPEVLPSLKEYMDKPLNGSGGSLHIIIDDHNIDDKNVKFCISYAKECGDDDGVKLAEKFLLLSKTQRSKISKLC